MYAVDSLLKWYSMRDDFPHLVRITYLPTDVMALRFVGTVPLNADAAKGDITFAASLQMSYRAQLVGYCNPR